MINKAAVQSWFLFVFLFFRWATLLYLAQNFKIIYPRKCYYSHLRSHFVIAVCLLLFMNIPIS